MSCGLLEHLQQDAAVRCKRTCEYERDDGHELNEDVEGRTRCILERITNGVANNSGLVRVAALTTMDACFDVLLGVVPCTTRVGHADGKHHTDHERADEDAGEHLHAEEEANEEWRENHEQTRRDHLADRCCR